LVEIPQSLTLNARNIFNCFLMMDVFDWQIINQKEEKYF